MVGAGSGVEPAETKGSQIQLWKPTGQQGWLGRASQWSEDRDHGGRPAEDVRQLGWCMSGEDPASWGRGAEGLRQRSKGQPV